MHDANDKRTTVERASDREMITTRSFNGPARIVFQAWTTPALLMRWWVPKSVEMKMVSCEVDARTGGGYRFAFTHASFPAPMAFFGKYLEVIPNARLVWTNEESADGPVTTVTFEEQGGKTLLTLRELYPSKEALDAALEQMEGGMGEQFDQLDALLIELGGRVG